MRISDIGEFGLIDKIQAILGLSGRSNRLHLGIGDDAAIFETPKGYFSIATVDTMIEGVHFDLRYTDFQSLGWKALAINLSDIAAMAGRPKWALVNLILPDKLSVENIQDLYRGLKKAGRRFNTTIIGGNIAKSASELSVTITVLGEARKNRWLKRSSAKPGDVIAVTGYLGSSHAGLQVLKNNKNNRFFSHVINRHLRPVPRFDFIELCLKRRIPLNACIDLSDGLSSDLRHLCEASRVGAVINCDRLPIHRETRKVSDQYTKNVYDYALDGGEDYELLVTMSMKNFEKAKYFFKKQLTMIGEITSGKKIILRSGNKELPLTAGGYTHF